MNAVYKWMKTSDGAWLDKKHSSECSVKKWTKTNPAAKLTPPNNALKPAELKKCGDFFGLVIDNLQLDMFNKIEIKSFP